MNRQGYTLVELLLGLVLGGLISTAALKLLQAQSTLARATAERGRRAEALRTAMHVLTAETRILMADRDVRALGPDSIALRAFRGSGIVCATNGMRAWVRYRGVRTPDPGKDSLVIVRDTLFEGVAQVQSVAASSGCGALAGEEVFQLDTDRPVMPGDAVALFESGSYYLTDGALRYRLGREGRQPVTSELFDNGRTSFAATTTIELHALLTLRSSASTARSGLRVRLPFSPRGR